MNLPLPPPAADLDEPSSRVRMSGLVADHTARVVPTLPLGPAWEHDDTTDEEDRAFEGVTAAVRVTEEPPALIAARLAERQAATLADEPDAVVAARRADRQTVAGVRHARRLPLTADESRPVPRLPEFDDVPKLPAPPAVVPRLPEPPRRPEAPRGDGTRLPLRAAANTPPSGHLLPRLNRGPATAAPPPAAPPAPAAPPPPLPSVAPPRAAPPRAEPPATVRAAPPPVAAPRTAAAAPIATPIAAPTAAPAAALPPRAPRPEPKPVVARTAPAGTKAAVAALADAPIPVAPRPPVGERQPAAPGHVIAGRYKIVDRIGVGGMGKVYKVGHTQLSKTFALKVIGENLADTDEARELFYREARLASAVNHPNITSVVDFGEDPDVGAFMVMEYVEGEPVHRVLRRETRLGVRVACEIILQVADALHYVHSQGIVHCDIKTENILLAEQAGTKRRQIVVKLLDFGLARSLTGGRSSGPLSGTPHYVSPERIRGDAATPSSDLYALGILFYELLTGHVPWDGAVSTILSGHLDQQPVPPSQLVPGLEPALETLILRAIAKTPAERHKDMAAFIYELRTVMDMLGFGHRRRGGGKRVVIERSKNERDAQAARIVDGCRLPLALISKDGIILVANPACARFVMGMVVEIEGLPLTSTPLASAWRTLDADLSRALTSSIRRVLEIDVPSGPSQRLLVWLDPCGDAVLFGVQPLDVA